MRCRATQILLALAILLPLALVTQFAQAQTFSVLYSFTGGTDGGNPWATLIQDAAGNLYGTTTSGGTSGVGVVFKLDPIGKETVLYTFTGGTDGGGPFGGLVRDGTGNLYGTTAFGGDVTCGCGTVFRLDPTTGSETVLYSFKGYPVDGALPQAGVVRDSVGNLYGAASGGGAYGDGIAFKVDMSGKETVLHNFTGGTDGAASIGDLVLDNSGNLYGTTFFGGGSEFGTAFRLSKTGKVTLLHTFSGTPDGQQPHGGVIRDAAGNLYGTTSFGGATDWGTVFKLDKAGKETVLYSFTGGADGGRTRGGSLVRDAAGNLYGITYSGGGGSCQTFYGAGCGVVFRLGKAGKESVLHTFTGADGGQSRAGVFRDGTGNLYGTTSTGGAHGSGVVFKIAP